MSAATEELLARHDQVQARRTALAAELKSLDTDSAAILHVLGLLDPSQAALARRRPTRAGRPKPGSRPEAYHQFDKNEVTPMMLAALRDAAAPMSVGDVTKAMLEAKAIDPDTVLMGRLSRRVSTNLQGLADKGRLRKHTDTGGVRWEINR